jgi:carbon-monoxide dehydrogenase medium subunit
MDCSITWLLDGRRLRRSLLRNCSGRFARRCPANPKGRQFRLLANLRHAVKVNVPGKAAARAVTIDSLITGAYETSLAPDEIMTGVEIPVLPKSQRASYLKFQLKERPTLGLALASI